MSQRAAGETMSPSRCEICAQENPSGGRFCIGCGAKLPFHCALCQALVRPDSRFCGGCGAALAVNATTNAAAPADREGERRQLTVLFCDMVGSTEMAGRLDVEDYHEVVRLYQHAASSAIVAMSGHVAQYLGDGIVAYFGWPIAYGDDAERAVRAGLEILDALERVNRNLRDDRKIAARVGIHTGRVVLGAIGVGARRETAALGETPNLAARVQSLAPAANVLITEATNRLVGGRFVVEALGAVPIRGIPRPVALYRVKRGTGLRNRLRSGDGSKRFIGRDAELRALNERWVLARGGAAQLVLIRGEAGMGKSRLAQHFYQDLRAQRHTWFEGYCSPFSLNTPFAPLIEGLSRVFVRRDDKSPYQALSRIKRAMIEAGLKPDYAMPVIAEMFNLPPPSRYAPLLSSPDQKRKRFIAAMGDWFLALARKQPLICLVEDIQWIDPSTREMIDYVIEHGESVPYMLIFTARPEFSPWWSARAGQAQLELGRLDQTESLALVKATAAGGELTDAVVGLVAERSGGIPLFIEELSRVVADQKGDVAASRDIPATIADSLMARLDRLGGAREIAQIASVIGRDFSYSILRELAHLEDAQLAANLRRLAEADLINASGTPPEAHYTFKHALLRDTAYDSLLRSRRRNLHGSVARLLAEQLKGDSDTAPERLAYHWTEAGQAAEASKAWQAAGDQVARRGALVEASAHFTRALEMLAQVPQSEQRDQREISLLMTLASIMSATRGLASGEAEAAFNRARLLGRKLHPDRATALLGTWQMHVTRGEATAAQELAEQRLKIAETENTPLALCWAHLALGMTLFHRGGLPASIVHLRRAVDYYTTSDAHATTFDAGPLAMAYLAVALALSGKANAARRMATEALEAARRLERPPTFAFCMLNAAALHWLLLEPEETLRIATEGENFARAHGLDQLAAGLEVYVSWATAATGDPSTCVERMRTAIAGWLANGQRLPHAWYLSILASVTAAAGRGGEALELIEEALGAVGEMKLEETIVLVARAEILSRSSVSAELIKAAWHDAVESAQRNDTKLFEVRAILGLAKALTGSGALAEARDRLRDLTSRFATFEAGEELSEARRLLAAPLSA